MLQECRPCSVGLSVKMRLVSFQYLSEALTFSYSIVRLYSFYFAMAVTANVLKHPTSEKYWLSKEYTLRVHNALKATLTNKREAS